MRGWWLIAGLVLWAGPGMAQTADEILARVREKYESINDAQISFTQRTVFAASPVEQSLSGTLLLRKPSMYRVELEGQTIVTDGKTVWSYSRPANQVLIDLFKSDSRGLSPERILTGDTEDYAATLLERETVDGRELAGVKLVPNETAASAVTIRLRVDPRTWLIRQAVLDDGNGKTTTYAVQEIHVNTGIPASRFTYDIPEGADVVDLR